MFLFALFVLSASASCASSGGRAPGMRDARPRPHPAAPSLIELARVEGKADERALLVVHPRTARSGSASAVVVDDQGRFLGAIAPGTASLLSVPAGARKLVVFSSVEVTAPVGAWFKTDEIAAPLPSGLVIRSFNQYFEVVASSKAELEHQLGESEVRWLEASKEDGQAWLDAHRRRLDELLADPLARHGTKAVTTRVVIR